MYFLKIRKVNEDDLMVHVPVIRLSVALSRDFYLHANVSVASMS